MGKQILLLFFLLHVISFATTQQSKNTNDIIQHHYSLAISTLSSLSSHSTSTRSLPLLTRLFHSFVWNHVNGLFTFSSPKMKEKPMQEQVKVESLVILPTDSSSVKRAKAIQILNINAYEHHHASSLMSLGNIFLV